MNASVSESESLAVSGTVQTGNEDIGASVGGYVGVEVGAEAHLIADSSGVSAGAEYHEVLEASATASGSAEKEGVGVSGSATAYAKTGTEVEGHLDAGTHGVDVGANACIGESVGVEGEVTEFVRYVSGTVGAGVSVGEHFEAGGSAEATCKHGVVTVGVAGDVAAVIGLDVDVSASVDTNQVVKDGKAVAHEVEKVAPVVTQTTTQVATQVVTQVATTATKTTNTAVSAVTNTAKSTVNTISSGAKKFFKKFKL
jgi:hypothetical protein